MREIPSVFETDSEGEATGLVRLFCSDDCRRDTDLPFTESTVYGASHLDDVPNGCVCETCGRSLE